MDARRDASTHTSVDDSTALVLLTTAVDREIERRHPSLIASSYRPAVDRDAYAAGGQAAQTVDLGDKHVRRSPGGLPPAPQQAA